MRRKTWRWAVVGVSVAAFAIVLAILLILLLPAPTSAPVPTSTPTPASKPTPTATPTATPNPGEVLMQIPSHAYPCADISATVAIGDVAGLQYGDFDVTYDPEVLEVTGVSAGEVGGVTVPAAGNWELVGSGAGGQGGIRFSVDLVDHETGVDGSGSLYVIRFHVPCAAATGEDTPLIFDDNELYNYNSAPIPLLWTGGLFTVRQTPTPTPTATPTPSATPTATQTPEPGEVLMQAPSQAHPCADISATVAIGDVAGLQYGDFDVTYDPDVLEVSGVSAGEVGGVMVPAAGNWGLVGSGEEGQGEIRFSVDLSSYEKGVDGSGSLCVIQFHVPCSALSEEYTSLEFEDGQLYDSDSAPIPLTWTGDLFVVRQTATPTPTATATPSPSPTTTTTPTPTATAEPTPTPTPRVQVWSAFALPDGWQMVHYPGVGTTFEATDGSDFIVLINISQVYRLKFAQYDLTYDPAVVEVVRVVQWQPDVRKGKIGGQKYPVRGTSFVPQKTQGRVRVIQETDDEDMAGRTGTGYLSRIFFHVIGPPGSTSPIDIDIETLATPGIEPIWAGVTNASVLVVPTPMPE